MAYKEWTIYAQKHKDVGLYFYQENTATEEPSETEYLIVRNAVAANQSIPTPPFYNTGLTLGQYCNYNYPVSQWYEYFVYRMTLQFDNDQDIPVGAPIEYARIEVKPYENKSDVDFDVVVQNGQPTYPHDPVVLADYFHEKYSENGGSLQTSGITLNVYNSILLNATGRSWLNITGDLIAKLCLKSSRDISATIPSDTDHDERISIDNTPDDQPRLIIHVTLSNPQPTTQAATDITTNEARLNGTIESIGWWLENYGFEFAEAGVPDSLSSITVGGSEDQSVTTFNYLKTGLSPGTTYYCRSWAYNAAGKGYGSWVEFTTLSLEGDLGVSTGAVGDIKIDNALGHGTIDATGGELGVYKCIERGFEVKLDFAGALGDYAFHYVAGFVGSVGFNMDTGNFEGTLIKTIRRTGSFDAGPFELWLARRPQTVFSDMLFAGETYSYRAYAINEDELKGYGDWIGFTTLQVLRETPGDPPDGGHIDGETTEIKNITIQNLEGGVKATRIGIRYGTTSEANEFDVHRDGTFDNGNYKFVLTDLIPGTKYYQIPYILIGDDGGVHEGSLIESETLSAGVGPGAEFPTPHYGPHGQDYREVVSKIFAEKLSAQPIIDFSGGKKSLKISNYLIQVQSNAVVIAGGYLDRFQFAKGKLVVEYATPMPFEREDTIDFDYGRIPFKPDGEGVIPFRSDGKGQIKFLNMVSVIVRKISLKMGITEKTVEYLATLELEEE